MRWRCKSVEFAAVLMNAQTDAPHALESMSNAGGQYRPSNLIQAADRNIRRLFSFSQGNPTPFTKRHRLQSTGCYLGNGR